MTPAHRALLADTSAHPTVWVVVVARGCHGPGRYRPLRAYRTEAEARASVRNNPRQRVVRVTADEWEYPSLGLTRADASWLGHDLDRL